MKKTISFNLEEDIIEKIEEYQIKNKLSSRSAALERMILKFDDSHMDKSYIEEMIKKLMNECSVTSNESSIEESPKKVEDVRNKDLDNSIQDAFLDMPE